jgi:hypothetical protein
MYNTPARFSQLSLDELYVLKRAFLESSYSFFMLGKYEKEEQKIHTALSNEILDNIRAKGDNFL